jgi:hypothetical protein
MAINARELRITPTMINVEMPDNDDQGKGSNGLHNTSDVFIPIGGVIEQCVPFAYE